jgi:hypothetical protein
MKDVAGFEKVPVRSIRDDRIASAFVKFNTRNGLEACALEAQIESSGPGER